MLFWFVVGSAVATASLPLHGADEPALKDLFKGKFLIGAAINERMTKPDHPAHAVLVKHFDSISPTNLLKWGPYNPEPGRFNEGPAEAFFAFGEQHKQYILAHALFWHQQTPKWVFEGPDGQQASRELLLQRMRERVRHVAQKYGARADAWDVVNETWEDDGRLRDSPFTKILGADFVAEAFKIAQEELPASVELLYNDYNMEKPGRIASVVKMVEELRAKGLRIDAIGNQAHWRLETPTIQEIEDSILAFKKLGVKLHYTELDVEVLPRRAGGAEVTDRQELTADNNPYTQGLPPEIQEKLAKRYADIFALFLKHQDVIERVTFWGVTDADSWLNNWPVRGRTNHPLLFDRQAKPKPAFWAVEKAAQKR